MQKSLLEFSQGQPTPFLPGHSEEKLNLKTSEASAQSRCANTDKGDRVFTRQIHTLLSLDIKMN